VIELRNLTKTYGRKRAVDDLTFTVHPGRITGFLGPNGAGKSTTMRLILGLARPTSGVVSVNGRRYRDLTHPLRDVGALLEARSTHPGRSAYHHLLFLAQANGIARRRVLDVLDLAGLTSVAGARTGGFSLGMAQRLGIAAALLGDPATLVLDEPVNGLDTDGIRWIRGLLRTLAAEGRTVLLSSHLMSEMEQTADHLIVIGAGQLLADTDMRAFIGHSCPHTVVRSPQWDRLRPALQALGAGLATRGEGLPAGVGAPAAPAGAALVTGMDAAFIGEVAAAHGITLHELSPRRESLEDVYTRITSASVRYRGSAQDGTSHQAAEAVR
jgi:ABC-2 type transport system ATP-binding protein